MRFKKHDTERGRKVGANNTSRRGEDMEINLPLPVERTLIRDTNTKLSARAPRLTNKASTTTAETIRMWRAVGRDFVSSGGIGVSADLFEIFTDNHDKVKGLVTLAMDGTKINPSMTGTGIDGKGEADLGGVCGKGFVDLDDRQERFHIRREFFQLTESSSRGDVWLRLWQLKTDDIALEVTRRALRKGLDNIRSKKVSKCHDKGFHGNWHELLQNKDPDVVQIMNKISDHELILRSKFSGCEALTLHVHTLGTEIAATWGISAEVMGIRTHRSAVMRARIHPCTCS